MEFDGRVSRVERDLLTGDYLVTFSTSELPASIKDVKNQDFLNIRAVKKRKKRSLDSNAYAWALISKMADVLHSSKDEVYHEMLRSYGQHAVDEAGQAVLVTVRSGIDLEKYGICGKRAGVGILNGREHTCYMVMRGSSTYDTREMSQFIDGVVSEAKELGIDTVPRVELEKMKAKWRL